MAPQPLPLDRFIRCVKAVTNVTLGLFCSLEYVDLLTTQFCLWVFFLSLREKKLNIEETQSWGKWKTSVSTGDKYGKSRNEQMAHCTPSSLQSIYMYKKYLYLRNKIKPATCNSNILSPKDYPVCWSCRNSEALCEKQTGIFFKSTLHL